jgi:hypothetical protein
MQIRELTAGARVLLEDGSIVEVVAPSQDGRIVQVRYLEAPFDAAMVGTEAECSDYDIVAFAGEAEMDSAAPPSL